MTKNPLLFLILLKITFSGVLIPDTQNPLMITNPTKGIIGTKLVLRFSLPKDSNGFHVYHYIGVIFPKDLKSVLSFQTPGKFNCSLKYIEGDNNGVTSANPTKIVNISASKPEIGKQTLLINPQFTVESNIAYCRIEDLTNNSFKPYTKFELQLEFTGVSFNLSYYISNLSIFTSTSNTNERIILDYNSSFGSFALYPNFTTVSKPAFEITNSKITVIDGPDKGVINPNIYAYNKFHISLNIKSNIFINKNDIYFSIQYPHTTINKATSVTSDKSVNAISTGTSVDPKYKSLSSDIIIKDFTQNSFLVENLEDDFYPGREFQLIFSNWQALDTNMNSLQSISLVVYYRNTYTVISFSRQNIIKILPTIITATINHPEYWDIYSNAAWPMRFKINVNNSIVNGGYLLIQHSNLIDGQVRWNFIASTCDFSENDSSYDNAFGRRGNCIPLRNDFMYPGFPNTTSGYSGSAIFIKISPLSNTKPLYVTVWGYADVCGTTFDPTIGNNITSYAQFTFNITIYKSIDVSQMNENRLSYSGNQIIAQSSSVSMGNKCWNSYISGITNHLKIGERYGTTVSATIGTDAMIFKEVTDFITLDALDLTCTTCILFDSFTSTNRISSAAYTQNANERFLYSSTKSLASGSFFFIAANIPKVSTADPLSMYLPGPFNSSAQYIPGRLQFQFSRKWVLGGNDYRPSKPTSCYVSWSAINNFDANPVNNPVKLIITNSSSIVNQNFIHTNSMMDTTVTQLPPQVQFNTGTDTIYRIVSNFEPANGPGGGFPGTSSLISWFVNSPGVNSAAPAIPYSQISLFTTCLRWDTSLPDIKNIYEYFDTQIQWISTQANSSLSPVTKVIRFVKLYMEGGIFQDYTTKYYDYSGFSKLIYNHHSFGTSTTVNSVCLIEINGTALKNSADTFNNTIIIFLKNAFHLEIDYTDNSSQYPIAPLVSNIQTYSNSSSLNISSDNHYSKGINLTIAATPSTFYDTLRNYYNRTPFLPYRTSYHNYLGASLILNGVTSNSVTTQSSTNIPNLLMPYYCPIKSDTTGSTNKITLNDPIVTVHWLSMTSYNSISKTSNIIADTSSITAGNINIVRQVSIQDRKTTIVNNTSGVIYNSTLRFATYSSSVIGNDKLLYLYNGTNKAVSAGNINCSSQVLFTNSKISLDKPENISYSGSVSFITSSVLSIKKAYIFGKPFTQAIFSTTGTSTAAPFTFPFTANTLPLPSLTSFSYQGIIRPSVSVYNNSNATTSYLSSLDLIGYFCQSSGDENQSISNYILDAPMSNFVLDYNPDVIAYSNILISLERNEQIFKQDKAAHLYYEYAFSY